MYRKPNYPNKYTSTYPIKKHSSKITGKLNPGTDAFKHIHVQHNQKQKF